MIKPPFTAKTGLSGVWIEDGDGVSVCDMNSLLDPEIAFDLATLLARGANEVLRQREHARTIAKKAGRPPSKKPSPMALAKRESRKRIKARQQKPD